MKETLKTISYYTAGAIAWLLFKVYFRVKVVNRGNVPIEGSLMIAANHLSYVDPLILGAFLPRRLWFIMSEEQFEKPGVHIFSRLMDVIPVKTGASFKPGAFKKALRCLKQKNCVAIFPEGRRSNTGCLLEPLPGLGTLAVRTGTPILPIAIVGTREAYPVGTYFPRPKKVTLYTGTPLECKRGDDPEELTSRAMNSIRSLLIDNGYADYAGERNGE